MFTQIVGVLVFDVGDVYSINNEGGLCICAGMVHRDDLGSLLSDMSDTQG